MYKTIYVLLFSIALLSFQCSGDQTGADSQIETAESEAANSPEESKPKVVAQPPPDTNRSASEIFETNADRYSTLYQTVSKNLDKILQRIDGTKFPEKMKDGLKASYEEVSKYKSIQDIAQNSKYTSAETIEQFMSGLEMYLEQWSIK